MTALVDLWPRLLACQHIPRVDAQLAAALGLDPKRHGSAGLVTCDQDDSMYVALDHATKYANVDVVFGRSFYAGSAHASGPFSGEVLGILAGADPDEVAEGLWALGEHLRTAVRFQTFPGSDGKGAGQPTFLAHVIPETGRYLSPLAGIAEGAPMAYLIAPPLESVLGIDAALKAADVRLAKHIPPPSETNFGGAFLAGELPAVQAARDAFVAAIASTAERPLEALRRPAYARHR